ncbi:ATP-binding protein [Okeanomitos corallinicola TIOX110]|uniref:ATP-binding protein n=1 Tax=Okeanomitos corallinicola TIOX110 TaxID=3133117 RepID=A0ABZ2US26_9CYAN
MLPLTAPDPIQDQKPVDFNLSTSLQLIGRSLEFERIVEILAQDGDLLITGVPGSGRRTLVKVAAQEVSAVVLDIDCIRATDGERFIQLLTEAVNQNWEADKIINWVKQNGSNFFIVSTESKLKLLRPLNQKQLWQAFIIVIELLQIMANSLEQRIVLILQSFPHLRSWDRQGLWESTLRKEIKSHPHVSYVLLATIAETNHQQYDSIFPLETIELAPLSRDVLALWAREILHTENIKFDPHSQALPIFLDAVQGNIGDAMALIRRLLILQHPQGLITEQQVKQVIEDILKDLSITYESLLMLLPPSQIHLLESLAVAPTDKPQSKEYIQKHGLSRGGSLQGALTGLQHKGLIYSAEQGYRLALPLLALWLKQRLS